MSQGNIIQGQASGKLGDTVLMVRNGTQVARVYTTSGARSGDAASFAARLQRVRFGSASNQWQLYRYICTRMFRKGRNTNQSDYNYFVKRNVDNLPFFTKLENADGVCCMMPGQFSEGNLGRIELLSRYGTIEGSGRVFTSVTDTINPMGEVITWTASVLTLKNRLKMVYPNARKVTYLIVSTSETQITESSEVFVSQFFQHYPVILDLYAESTPGENAETIKKFFSDRIADANIKSLIDSLTTNFCSTTSSFAITSTGEAYDNTVDSFGLLMFATNDLVSDCYTTIVPQSSVSITRGVYSVWGGYRTANALQVACDSYGFQSGVMRDEVATSDRDSNAQVQAYTAKLRALDPEAATAFEKEVSELGGAIARRVSRPAESEE